MCLKVGFASSGVRLYTDSVVHVFADNPESEPTTIRPTSWVNANATAEQSTVSAHNYFCHTFRNREWLMGEGDLGAKLLKNMSTCKKIPWICRRRTKNLVTARNDGNYKHLRRFRHMLTEDFEHGERAHGEENIDEHLEQLWVLRRSVEW